jgi:putative hydrolase of the HAD superfamily
MEWALERLGVDEAVFDAVVCFETMNPHLFGDYAHAVDRRPAKPVVDAIVAGLRAAGSNPRRTVRDSWPAGSHYSLTYYSTTWVRSRLVGT